MRPIVAASFSSVALSLSLRVAHLMLAPAYCRRASLVAVADGVTFRDADTLQADMESLFLCVSSASPRLCLALPTGEDGVG